MTSGATAAMRSGNVGKTYKDRDLKDLPRVPEWARAKPTRIHGKSKRKPQDDDDFADNRERYYDEVYEQD